jgi:hypothetical protein
MPPAKKNTVNTIFQYKNIAKAIEAETIAEKNNNIENTNSKSLDTYFGITEKPPSPIPEIISTVEKELDRNDTLTLKEIKNRIDNLYETELIEIYKIIKGNKEKYTVNNNGIFVNICNLKPISITEITQFLIFSEKNNKLIDKEEEERDLYRELVS